MATNLCDTEQCTTCGATTLTGIDQNSQCDTCARGALDHLLRSMAAGVTRDRQSGRFVKITKIAKMDHLA